MRMCGCLNRRGEKAWAGRRVWLVFHKLVCLPQPSFEPLENRTGLGGGVASQLEELDFAILPNTVQLILCYVC